MKLLQNHLLKGTFGLVLLLLISAPVLMASPQDPAKRTPEERAKRLTGVMKDELKLNPTQETRVYDVNLTFAKKNEALRTVQDTAQRRKSAEANEKARDVSFRSILTADQYKSYLKLKEEMKARRKQGGGSGR